MLAVSKQTFTVALAGNPNCGKTSLFNALTGVKAHVGNYPGVTVEKRSARVILGGKEVEFVDLPGIYSLTAVTLDEVAARNFILRERPDLVINIVDSGNLERNLYLTTQLMEIGVRMIVVLNMWDEAERQGVEIDEERLTKTLQAPVVRTIGHRGVGIDKLEQAITEMLKTKEDICFPSFVRYGKTVDEEIDRITHKVASTSCNTLPPRWYAVNLLEDAINIDEFAEISHDEKDLILSQVSRSKNRIHELLKKFPDNAISDGRYEFIRRTLDASYKRGRGDRMALSNRIDNLVTHKFLGYPIFLLFMWILFQVTFKLGQYPASWIDKSVTALSNGVASLLPAGFLSDLIAQGVIGGAGSVLVFMPNIMILFLGIAFLEDTGYMARAAFIMDRLMRMLGLQGRSFVPLLMGFGCNVPAIMATRTLESQRDRILTILLIPFMSCSARLSVYVLFCGAFFPSHAGNIIFLLYLIGVLVAVFAGRVMKNTIFKADSLPLIIEFPPYRKPTMKVGLMHMWQRGKVYLQKMGGIILLASVILWFFGAFPKPSHYTQDFDSRISTLQQSTDQSARSEISRLQAAKASEDVQYSLVGRVGHAVEPLLKPLGFNWQMGVSLITGFVAKEVVVSSMGVLYQLGDEVDENSTSLVTALRNPAHGLTPLAAFGFMLFVLLYTPCISVLVVVKREIGWKWMMFGIFVQLFLAWMAAFAAYRLGTLLGLG